MILILRPNSVPQHSVYLISVCESRRISSNCSFVKRVNERGPPGGEIILAGTKKFEYRKRLAKGDINCLFIYSTYPIMKVVAKVEIVGTLSASPSALWEKTKAVAGISRKKYREYFHGCPVAHAYELGTIEIFTPAKELQDFNISLAPQSFVYLNTEC